MFRLNFETEFALEAFVCVIERERETIKNNNERGDEVCK